MSAAKSLVIPLAVLSGWWPVSLSAALEHQSGYPAGATDLVPHNAALPLTVTTKIMTRKTFSIKNAGPHDENAAVFFPLSLPQPDWLTMPLTVPPTLGSAAELRRH